MTPGPPYPGPLIPHLRGHLLVANPLLPDLNFDRSVVLVLAHGGEGALGVILNRPSDTMLYEVLAPWADVVAPPGVLFTGGPVNSSAVIGLARSQYGMAATRWKNRVAWTTVCDDIGTVDLELDPHQVADDLAAVRVFVGYAGWTAGQLEGEIAAGAWWVVEALPDDAFGERPDLLWRNVLRRQGGSLSLVAAFPPDVNAN